MSEYDEETRGRNAQALLDDPLLAKALNECRQAIVMEWESTRESEGREYLWRLHRASMKFEEILRGYIDSGKIAKANLKEGKSVTQRIRSAF